MPLIDHLNPYAYAMRLRRMMYAWGWLRSYDAGIPIISVGNLTMGGTGKSPLVLLIAEYLEAKHGKKVAIVSRGYKRRSKGYVLVRAGKKILAPVVRSGDEAQMFAEAAPNAIVIVDEDRVHGAREAKKLGADVIVLDDGFQHLRLRRDLNILLGNGKNSPVIPFGRSRELASAARAADLLVSTVPRDERNSNAERVVPDAVIESVPASLMSLNGKEASLLSIKGMRVLALSSIASPARFHEMLRSLGAEVIANPLGDHAEYSEALVRHILAKANAQNAAMIVTTTKDIVKSRMYFERVASTIPIMVLSHKLEFLRGEERFYSAIDKII